MAIEIKLPELGDGIDSGDVLSVLVQEGDVIEKEQGIVELETDKATVEVPSTHAGKVTKVLVKAGQTVPVGAPLITIEAANVAKQEQSPEREEHDGEEDSAAEEDVTTEEDTAVEVVQPSKSAAKPEKKPKQAKGSNRAAPTQEPKQREEQAPPRKAKTSSTTEAMPASASGDGDTPIPAGPAVRRFAREVGVDLAAVHGSGPSGRITRDDVLEVVRRGTAAVKPEGDVAQTDAWGPIRTERMTKIRQTIARKMHESWTTVPRVTNFDDADVTELEEFRQSSKADYADRGIKLTTLPFVIKSVAMALRRHPLLNAALDLENNQIVYKQYVNVGVAVDTERGLVVPALRHADKLTIPEIARELATIAEQVRTGEFNLEDLRGGTFTVSNLGAIGGAYSTPIINVPEVAILLLGRTRKLPVVVGDKIEVRLMMPLSLSYDHRLVDGAAAARFLNEVIGYLKAPSRLLLAP
jgi:pyruvate/2-oxoglutarate dehydrogenase complex dihydrolipoamide acyltransferase (E2) component